MNLATIMNQKAKIRTSLETTRNKYVAIIFEELAKGHSITDIRRKIGVPKYKFERVVAQESLKLAKKVKKELDGVIGFLLLPLAGASTKSKNKKIEQNRADLVFKAMKKSNFYEESKKVEVALSMEYETEAKKDMMEYDMKQARSNEKIFYLISSHDDCAVDHLDYQGKLYYDSAWRNYVKDESIREQIEAFIKQYKLKTFQWVTRRPVWLITRPNCRHYYTTITTDEALVRYSYKELVERHGMHHTEGQKKVQSIRHSLNKEWYTRENIEQIIKQYEERRNYHFSMRRQRLHSPLLEEAIRKDNYLIKKWRTLLAKIK